MMPGDVDAVILNYGTAPLAARAARSAREAGAGSILVVDNGSPDGSAARLETEVGGFARVLALPDNEGFAAGNNRGAAAGRRPLLLLMNSDVALHAGALEAMIAVLAREPRVGIVAPALFGARGEPQASAYRFITPGVVFKALLGLDKLAARLRWPALGANADLRRNGPYDGLVESLYGPCLLVRRDAFEAVGGFDEDFFLYCEETDLVLRLAKRGWRAYRAAGAAATHDHNQTAGRAPARSLLLMNHSHRLYARKHFGPAGRLATAGAFGAGLALRWLLSRRADRPKYAAALRVWFGRAPDADPRPGRGAAGSVPTCPAKT